MRGGGGGSDTIPRHFICSEILLLSEKTCLLSVTLIPTTDYLMLLLQIGQVLSSACQSVCVIERVCLDGD